MGNIIEKEVKYSVDSPAELVAALKKQNAVYVGYHFERTVRIDTPDWAFSNGGRFLRLRSGFKKTLTLKEARTEGSEVSERREIEIEVSDLDSCQDIFKAIGLTASLVMEKYRMLWKINDTSVTIDELPFGVYAEIEGPVSSIKILSPLLGFDYEKRIILTYWELHERLPEYDGDKNIVFPEDYTARIIV